MTIIRSKVSQNFTIVSHTPVDDKDFDSKYLGVYLRLISKGENWEISALGLANLYPTNGTDFYRNALKHMCKLGYLVRIPKKRNKGQFAGCIMELYDQRQIDEPLSDEDVDKLFSKESMNDEEIQKIYPKRVFQHDSADEVKQCNKEHKEEKIKETTTESCCCSFEDLEFKEEDKRDILVAIEKEGYSESEVRSAVDALKKIKDKDNPPGYLLWLLRNPCKAKTKRGQDEYVSKVENAIQGTSVRFVEYESHFDIYADGKTGQDLYKKDPDFDENLNRIVKSIEKKKQ